MVRDWGPVHTELGTVTEVGDGRVVLDGGWSWPGSLFPDDVAVGEMYIVQSVKGSTPRTVARVVSHKTDEDLDREHEEMVAGFKRDRDRLLEEHREEWTAREKALPKPLRDRLANFREKGRDFDSDGWGYELVICELAVLYSRSGGEDTDEIMAYAHEQGTSGNQHDYAKVLGRMLSDEPEQVGTTVSALSPLGSGAYYEGSEA
jgi:hypothetical protein